MQQVLNKYKYLVLILLMTSCKIKKDNSSVAKKDNSRVAKKDNDSKNTQLPINAKKAENTKLKKVSDKKNAKIAYIKPNEQSIFSFSTTNGKKLVVVMDKMERYLVCRFGTDKKIELKLPHKLDKSWDKFYYYSYFRGGGPDNEGLEIYYLYITIGDKKYIIYDEYSSSDSSHDIGMKIKNLKTKKVIDIKGVLKSKKGDLSNLKDIDSIQTGEEQS